MEQHPTDRVQPKDAQPKNAQPWDAKPENAQPGSTQPGQADETQVPAPDPDGQLQDDVKEEVPE